MTKQMMRTATFILSAGLTLWGCAGVPSEQYAGARYGDRAAFYAQKFIGARYRWGGNTPKRGFDCSGLVQYSYRLAGLKVPRNTEYQYRASQWVARNRLRKGDLLFFNQQGKRLSHVGIYIGNERFVHAPATGKRVYISTLSNPYWRRHLASTRRFERF